MSYGLKNECNTCMNNYQCIDSVFIQAAISGIHSVNYANGKPKQLHLGAGTIEIQCSNFRGADEQPKPLQECPK